MEDLVIRGKKETFFIPTVNFKVSTGRCELSGESYLEDTFTFYQALMDWIKEYTETIRKPITFHVGLTYFNTASSRSILDLLLIMKEYKESGGEVTVNWHVEEWDEDMQHEVEDFTMDSGLEINLIQHQEGALLPFSTL